MEKIWVIFNNCRNRSYRLYKKESDLLRDISKDSNLKILEYRLESSTKANDYIKSKDREHRIKGILGEITDEHRDIQNFISLFEKLAPEDKLYKKAIIGGTHFKKIKTPNKLEILNNLKKFQQNKKEIVRIIKNNKKYLFSRVSTSVDWYLCILKIHNFRDHIYGDKSWNNGKFEIIDTSTKEIRKNFKLAKLKLKNE
jgi:hypothetical protein